MAMKSSCCARTAGTLPSIQRLNTEALSVVLNAAVNIAVVGCVRVLPGCRCSSRFAPSSKSRPLSLGLNSEPEARGNALDLAFQVQELNRSESRAEWGPTCGVEAWQVVHMRNDCGQRASDSAAGKQANKD